jgi:hypothetical protein
MPNHISHKEAITKAVLAELPGLNTEVGLDEYIRTWWFTKSGAGLRLTASGDQAFRTAQIEYFDVPLSVKHVSWYAFLSDCNKKLKCPYYISSYKTEEQKNQAYLRLYDSKIAMMLTLYGDILSYLESIKTRK